MNLPETFIWPSSTFDPYYGLRFGIHNHWDKEQHWDRCPLDHGYYDSRFICSKHNETYLFHNYPLLKIYVDTYLKDFLKDYE